MIQANEVRIGNYIEFDNRFFKIDVISEVYPTLNTAEFGIGVVDWNNIKPIELTEERLLQCGFKHTGNGFYELLGTHIGLCNIGDVFFNVGFKGITIGNIKYLHQLQNLYFALTGKELEINL